MPVLLFALLLSCDRPASADPASADPASADPAWACPLGPVVGSPALQPAVAAGLYEAELDYSQDSLPTMERTFSHDITGRAWLRLDGAGAFEACLGLKETRSASVSKYASRDGEHHTSEDESRSLLHLLGEWTSREDGARLVVRHLAWNECAAPAEAMTPVGGTQLVCGSLPAAPPLPVGALACRALGALPGLESAGLELNNGRRAGAWALRQSPMDRGALEASPPCGPWLVLGAGPGLTIRSEEGRHDERPTVTFTAGARPMVLKAYLTAAK